MRKMGACVLTVVIAAMVMCSGVVFASGGEEPPWQPEIEQVEVQVGVRPDAHIDDLTELRNGLVTVNAPNYHPFELDPGPSGFAEIRAIYVADKAGLNPRIPLVEKGPPGSSDQQHYFVIGNLDLHGKTVDESGKEFGGPLEIGKILTFDPMISDASDDSRIVLTFDYQLINDYVQAAVGPGAPEIDETYSIVVLLPDAHSNGQVEAMRRFHRANLSAISLQELAELGYGEWTLDEAKQLGFFTVYRWPVNDMMWLLSRP